MSKQNDLAAYIAAVFGCVAVVLLGVGRFLSEANNMMVNAPITPDSFMAYMRDYPQWILAFFAADSLFVMAYSGVFVGLYTVTKESAGAFALFALACGLIGGAFDAIENAIYITFAQAAINGETLASPDLVNLYLFTNLKWMGAFVAMFTFGLIFPRRTNIEKALSIGMILFPLFGMVGIANTLFNPGRGLFFVFGMPLYAYFFRQRYKS